MTTAACSRFSLILNRAKPRGPTGPPVPAGETGIDRRPRQAPLRQERDARDLGYELFEIICGVGGDENHPRVFRACQPGKLTSHLEAGLLAKVNVQQDDIRLQLAVCTLRLRSGRGDTHDGDSLGRQQVTGSTQEVIVVVDDQAAPWHAPSMPRDSGYVALRPAGMPDYQAAPAGIGC